MKPDRLPVVFLLLLAIALPCRADIRADSLRAERAREDSLLAHSPLSPFAAIGQMVLNPELPLRVVLAADTLLLGYPSADPGLPQLEFIWQPAGPKVYLRSPNGGDFRVNRQLIGPVPVTVTDADTVSAEKFLLKVYASRESARVRAFEPDGAGQRSFHGLTWYEPDPAYRVTARIEPADRDTVVMPTSAGLRKSYLRHSTLYFSFGGAAGQLTLFSAVSDPDDYGFVPFTDATSGEETYGGGRYLDLDLPADGQSELVLDFNDAYNPLCAYVPYYNCPIPPAENALNIPIRAGEKSYANH